MVSFSKFIIGQRNSRQLLDSDGYTYVRRKDKDTSTAAAWRCTKHGCQSALVSEGALVCPRFALVFIKCPRKSEGIFLN